MDFDTDNHSFTFRFHSADGYRDLEMNCNALFIGDILDQFRDFLQGCGYVIDGHLEVISWSEPEVVTTPQKEYHEGHFDFSNIPNNNWPFHEKKTDDSVYSPVVHPSEK